MIQKVYEIRTEKRPLWFRIESCSYVDWRALLHHFDHIICSQGLDGQHPTCGPHCCARGRTVHIPHLRDDAYWLEAPRPVARRGEPRGAAAPAAERAAPAAPRRRPAAATDP